MQGKGMSRDWETFRLSPDFPDHSVYPRIFPADPGGLGEDM